MASAGEAPGPLRYHGRGQPIAAPKETRRDASDSMERRTLKGGKLKAGAYDERDRRLEIEFVDGAVRVYKGVPGEVWRRLLSSPNPGSYFEDRIADEYPNAPGSAAAAPEAKSRLDALFGTPPKD